MFSINNFESAIPQKILARGQDYFDSGAVYELEELEPGVWQAAVEGTAPYEVVAIFTKKQQVEGITCNCPYDEGICKHAVAVLFSIREQLAQPKSKRPKARQPNFEDLLLKLEADELRDFIRSQHLEDQNFGEKFMVFFAGKVPGIDVAGKYAALIRQSINRYSDRGFIDYRGTYDLSRELQPVLIASETALARKEFSIALAILKALLKELLPVIESCDDSSGSIGGTLSNAISIIEQISETDSLPPSIAADILDYTESSLKANIWFDYGDFGYQLLVAAANAASRIDPERYLSLLDTLKKAQTGAYDEYSRNYLTKEKIRFLRTIGRTAEADKLTAQNLDITGVRKAEVEKAVAAADFDRAKQLLLDGIRLAEEKRHPGTVESWEIMLLDIAKHENDTERIRHYAKKFALDRSFRQQYYLEWKHSFSATEWPAVIEQHIREVTEAEQNRPRRGAWDKLDHALFLHFSPIYIQEQQWERLLQLLPTDADLHTLNTVHSHLCPRYPAEMLARYMPVLEAEAERANSRNDYRRLAAIMQTLKHDISGSHEAVKALAWELLERYPRRSAMAEEFRQLL